MDCKRCGGTTTGDSSEESWKHWCGCYRPRYKPYKKKKKPTPKGEARLKQTHGAEG